MQIDNPNSDSSPLAILKTFAVEIGIILSLTIVVIATLNYLKIIDIKVLFSPQPDIVQKSENNISPSPKLSSTRSANTVQNNPGLSQLQLLSKNKALHYAQSLTEFEGKIKTIDVAGGVDGASNRSYQIRLELNIGTESATFLAMYPKEAMEKVKILDSNKKALTIKDLKVGDFVIIKTNLGTLRQYPNNFNEVVITKK